MSVTTTFFPDKEIIEINRVHVKDLKDAANKDFYKRARICLHKTPDDPIHEMLIAMHRDSYVRPHRNVRKSKSYYVVEGEMYIVSFDEWGNVTQKIGIGAGSEYDTFICRLNTNLWHTVIPVSEMLVFLETNGGPFIKEDEEYAVWSPEINDKDGIRLFLERLIG